MKAEDIAKILAAATAATNLVAAVAPIVKNAYAKGEVTDAEFEAALGRKATSEDRWDAAVKK